MLASENAYYHVDSRFCVGPGVGGGVRGEAQAFVCVGGSTAVSASFAPRVF